MTLKIVRRAAGAECASILAELPEWFGIPESNAGYAELAEREQAWVAEESGATLGLMVLIDHGFSAVDIHLLAVRPHAHRRGVGKALVRQALAVTRELGKPYLTVKIKVRRRNTNPTSERGRFMKPSASEPWKSSPPFGDRRTPA